MIKISGQALSLEEMERAILQINGIRDCACCGIKDEVSGEVAVCLVVREEDRITENLILKTIANSFNRNKLPKKIIFSQEIPKTANGKIKRSYIVEHFFG